MIENATPGEVSQISILYFSTKNLQILRPENT